MEQKQGRASGLLKKILFREGAKHARLQPLWSRLHTLAVSAMNYGGGGLEGEPLLCDTLPYLYGPGFRLTGIEPAESGERTQEVFQFDGIFFRVERLPGGDARMKGRS